MKLGFTGKTGALLLMLAPTVFGSATAHALPFTQPPKAKEAVDKAMVISDVKLKYKAGGKSGSFGAPLP